MIEQGYLKEGFESEELCKDASNCPHVNGACVMLAAEEELWGSVPDGDYNAIFTQGSQWRLEDAGKAEVTDFHHPLLLAFAHDENVGGFEVTVDDPVAVKVVQAVEDLPQQRLHGVGVDVAADLLPVVPDDLVQVVLGVVERQVQGHVAVVDVHVHQLHDVLVYALAQQHDLANRRRRHPVALLRLLELLYRYLRTPAISTPQPRQEFHNLPPKKNLTSTHIKTLNDGCDGNPPNPIQPNNFTTSPSKTNLDPHQNPK
jgi:hypothetical protein